MEPPTIILARDDAPAADRSLQAPLLVAAWWLLVVSVGLVVIVFGPYFLPEKYGYDAAIYLRIANSWDLWEGISFDSYVNTARFWALVLMVMPYEVAIPIYYCAVVALAMRLFKVFEVTNPRYQLLAGAWMACSSLFVSLPNKEIIALPIALGLCLASTRRTQVLATVLFLAFAVFYRPYWAITFFYFIAAWMALRLHIRHRPVLAIALMVVAFALPFAAADLLGLDPLTDARMGVNADRVDSPDAQTAINNLFPNTGFITDVGNAALLWVYMNIPLTLLALAGPQHLVFVAFQLSTLWFFCAALAELVRDARRPGGVPPLYLRCAAFAIAYSLTQSMFEPDFGSFMRHEVLSIVPILVVAFYRMHARRRRSEVAVAEAGAFAPAWP
jgi:hypothetical protein